MQCVLPEPNELFVDLDDEGSLVHMHEMLSVLRSNGYGCQVVAITESKSGKGHRHARLKVDHLLEPIDRIALQACLGSDRKRELLSFLRIGSSVPTTTFFEPKEKSTASA